MTASSHALVRFPTGNAGLDVILHGGLFEGGIYIVSGRPGAGKTILANQIAFRHVAAGGRVVYATLLAETHGRMLSQLAELSYFREEVVGKELVYLNGLGALTDNGLAGLLELSRRMVRDQRATLLIIDGMVTAELLARSELDYKRFIGELQTWVATVGCTVLLVTSNGGAEVAPEHTMVDGIVELAVERRQMRAQRTLTVTKLRGSAFIEGAHQYVITDAGLVIYPRIEARAAHDGVPGPNRLSTGVPGLDPILGGGVLAGSTTLLLGSSGCGKTIAGLQFLADGAARGESVVHFGFYESPPSLLVKGDRLGLELTKHAKKGDLHVEWNAPTEPLIDALGDRIIALVERHRAKRLFIDGFVGFRLTSHPERISAVFSAVGEQLMNLGVTTVISDETRELFVRDVEVPTQNVSAMFHNILFLRQVEQRAALVRLLSVMKTRDSGHDRRLWELDITDRGVAMRAPFMVEGEHLIAGGVGGPKGRRSGPTPEVTRDVTSRKPATKGARAKKR